MHYNIKDNIPCSHWNYKPDKFICNKIYYWSCSYLRQVHYKTTSNHKKRHIKRDKQILAKNHLWIKISTKFLSTMSHRYQEHCKNLAKIYIFQTQLRSIIHKNYLCRPNNKGKKSSVSQIIGIKLNNISKEKIKSSPHMRLGSSVNRRTIIM